MNSFESTYKENYLRLYSLVRKVINDENVAYDILQDVFVRYYEKLENGYEFRNTHNWLTRVTLNESFDYLKQKKVYVQLDEVNALAADDGPDETHRRGRMIRQAASKLKPQELKLILLYSEGYSYKEIAEMAEIKFTSVGKSLSRAICKIKEILKKNDNEMY